MEMVFVARMIRNKSCIIYAFFDYFFQKSFFTRNYCYDKFDYPGSIVYLSCLSYILEMYLSYMLSNCNSLNEIPVAILKFLHLLIRVLVEGE